MGKMFSFFRYHFYADSYFSVIFVHLHRMSSKCFVDERKTTQILNNTVRIVLLHFLIDV